MGWLGWTDREALDADVNAIQIAYKGKVDMLKACFGSGDDSGGGSGKAKSEKPDRSVSSRPMSPKLFDAMFGGGKGG